MAKRPFKTAKNFWLLSIFFGIFTVIGLIFMWSQPGTMSHSSSMMGSTMGSMMKNQMMPLTINDLFKPGEYIKSNMSAHHQGDSLIAKTHFATTVIIVLLLPFIIGGLAFLVILWQK